MLTLLHGHQKVKKERFVAPFKVETRKLDTNPTMPNQPNHAQPTQPTEHPTTFRPQEATVQPGCKVEPWSLKTPFFCWDEVWKNHPIFSQKTRLHNAMWFLGCSTDMYIYIYIEYLFFICIYTVYTYISLCKFDPHILWTWKRAHNIWRQKR